MICKRLLVHIFFLVSAARLCSQSNIEILKSGMSPNNNYVRHNNTALLGDQAAGGISYSDVEGTAFWDNNWRPALLTCTQNRAFMLKQVRLNFYSGAIHYTDSTGREMIATDIIQQVTFFNGSDTSRPIAVFEKVSLNDVTPENTFCQVLNEGNIRLLKLFVTQLDSRFDPLAAKTTNKFITKSNYSISVNGIVKPLKKLDKDNIFEHLTNTPQIQEWLKKDRNTLKNEFQVIRFLNYYNELVKREPLLQHRTV